ncbi:EAL domain-containing protein [Zhongshania sp.]|uniref:EAL domain-containing protein n=1 Tax=Zhongshania sp. TaxID=1971902 RepID=UPI0039E4E6F1
MRFIHEREQDRTLAKSIVEISHSLSKKVIVEGIERRAALHISKEMGLEYAQGHHVCRPILTICLCTYGPNCGVT